MALREQREKAGLTQAQLGEVSGLNPRMVQYYEQGYKDINGAKLKTLLKVCDALGCSLSDIITDPETLELLNGGNY